MKRRVSPLALLLGFALSAPLLFGCGRQSEGERCSLLNGDRDCDAGLVCTPANELRGGDDQVDRCCPPDERSDADPRCRPRAGASSPTGSGGADGGTGAAGSAGQGGANN